MPPWLQSSVEPLAGTHPGVLATRLLLALALGLLVAAVYRRTNGGSVVPSFRATLVLLTILIAAVTQVIGDNVARAFSLVGALSIVRFRTVVQDTRDTAFVIFAVTVGMAVGAGDMWVAGLSLLVVGTAAAVVSYRPKGGMVTPSGFQLAVNVAIGYQAEALLTPVFEKHVTRAAIVGIATANKGAALESTYDIWLRTGTTPATLIDEVNQLQGVQSVQLRLLDR